MISKQSVNLHFMLGRRIRKPGEHLFNANRIGQVKAVAITLPDPMCHVERSAATKLRNMRLGFQTSPSISMGDRFADDQRLKAWPRPEYFRDCVAASRPSE